MAETNGARWHAITIGGSSIEMLVSENVDVEGRVLWPSVGEYPIYDDFCYQVMLQDEHRNRLFRDAIVDDSANRVVVELGTGPDLLWSSLAAESGAARVFAVEVLEDSARAAAERAREIGPHVSVLHGEAGQISLDERADVCIAELVGAIGGSEGIATIIEDARNRHLTPEALVVPHQVRTPIAALGVRQALGCAPVLDPSAALYIERVLSSVGKIFDLRMGFRGVTESDVVTTTALLEDLNLSTGIHEYPDELRLEVTRPGEIDSCLAWLDMRCAPEHPSLDSLRTPTNWIPVLIPFTEDHPVPVEPGDVLTLNVTQHLHDDVHPEWTFSGEVRHHNGTTTPVHAESPYASGDFRTSWLHRALFRNPAQPD